MDKKNILTYEGLKKLEDELEDLKVVKRKAPRRSRKQESRAICPRMQSTMQLRTSREILRHVLKSLRRSSRMLKYL